MCLPLSTLELKYNWKLCVCLSTHQCCNKLTTMCLPFSTVVYSRYYVCYPDQWIQLGLSGDNSDVRSVRYAITCISHFSWLSLSGNSDWWSLKCLIGKSGNYMYIKLLSFTLINSILVTIVLHNQLFLCVCATQVYGRYLLVYRYYTVLHATSKTQPNPRIGIYMWNGSCLEPKHLD